MYHFPYVTSVRYFTLNFLSDDMNILLPVVELGTFKNMISIMSLLKVVYLNDTGKGGSLQ